MTCVMMCVLASAVIGAGQENLQKYLNDTACKVKATDDPSQKRAILSEKLENMSKALDIVENSALVSDEDRAGIDRFKAVIQDRQNELAGTNGYDRVPDAQLNDYSDYVVQDVEQAARTVTISLVASASDHNHRDPHCVVSEWSDHFVPYECKAGTNASRRALRTRAPCPSWVSSAWRSHSSCLRVAQSVPLTVQRSLPRRAAPPPRYSIVCIIHGDAGYLYHDTSGNAHRADEDALAGARTVAERNTRAEMFIFHERPRRHFLLLFPVRDGILLLPAGAPPRRGILLARSGTIALRS